MDQDLHSGNAVIGFFAALVVAACGTSVRAQVCDGAVARAVQVKFADCGEVPDNVSVYIGSNVGALLPLTKASNGYWETDKSTFEPVDLTLCSHTCRSLGGCAGFSETVEIERGRRLVCAARYLISCNKSVWKLHVETEPGWVLVYKRLKRTSGATEQEPIPKTALAHKPLKRTAAATKQEPIPEPHPTPYDLCDLDYDEQVEPILQLRWFAVAIPLKVIDVSSFGRGATVDVNRDDLARGYQAALGTKRTLSAEELDLLPKRITFKIDR
jgi:hypothetical protein